MTAMHSRWLATLVGLGLLLALLPALLLLAGLDQDSPEMASAQAAEEAGGGERDLASRPAEEWTARLRLLQEAGAWDRLHGELEAVAEAHPDLYERFELRYLHGRVKASAGDEDGAREALAPYAAEGHPMRALALHHLARTALADGDEGEAARLREALIFGVPEGAYRDQALADHVAFLADEGDPGPLLAFAGRLAARADEAVRRHAQAHAVQALEGRDRHAEALARGLAVLRERQSDDPALRVFRVLDGPAALEAMSAADRLLMGETARHHRVFDRAVALLRRALRELPSRREDLLFAVGRCHFGAEQFAEAEKAYLEGAALARDGDSRGNFLYHAARAAQLQGEDARAEGHLGRAISASAPPPGRSRASGADSPRAAVALTQRLRIRLAQGRYADAEADLRQIRRLYPRGAGWVDSTVAYAAAMVGAGREEAALEALRTLPSRLTGAHEAAEVHYWRGRAFETRNASAAVASYLQVLRAEVPTHFAHLARERIFSAPALAARAGELAKERAGDGGRWQAQGELERARAALTDAALLAPPGAEAEAHQRLRVVYEALPRYGEVLALDPYPMARLPAESLFPPASPSPSPGAPAPSAVAAGERAGLARRRFDLLVALGLVDDAAALVAERYPLSPPASALTRALVLHEAGATRGSIRAMESMMGAVPDDYLPELLPSVVRRLLYPRDFYAFILEDAREHGADPRLVLAIMREESRFDPRAKSAAAARGLLQFIVSTAREVGAKLGLVELSAEDLYDPRTVIRLGAKYLGDLLQQFEGNPYRAAAAYNAGPAQAALWARMAPGPGSDAYLTAINFEETKHYVRKVMNSYHRYAEIYGPAARRAAAEGGGTPPDGGR